MENLKPQTNTKNLESDKSAALLTDDELNTFRNLSKEEKDKQQEERLHNLEELQNKFRKAVEEANKTGNPAEALKLKTVFDKEAEELKRMQKTAEEEESKKINKNDKEFQKKWIQDIYNQCFDKNGNYLNPTLSKEDLKFMYEIDSPIFDKEKNYDQLKKIYDNRDIKSDISSVTGYKKEEISTSKDDDDKVILSAGKKFHFGDIYYYDSLSGIPVKDLKLPENICGSLHLDCIYSVEDNELKLPKYISGKLDLINLTSAKFLQMPEHIGGDFDLSGLKSFGYLKLPERIDGNLFLNGLKSTEGLKLPEHIGDCLILSGLTSAKNLVFPKSVGGSLFLDSLKSTKGLELPDYVGSYLGLDGLKSAKGLELPKYIGYKLTLRKLKSAQGLKLPESLGGIDFSSDFPFKEKEKLKKLNPQYEGHY